MSKLQFLDTARKAVEDTARKAVDHASTKAGELKQGVADTAGGLADHASATAGELKQGVVDKAGELRQGVVDTKDALVGGVAERAGDLRDGLADRLSDMQEGAVEKVREFLDQFNAALPVVAEAGYRLEGVDVCLGLPPRVVAHFASAAVVADETIAELLKAHADKRFTVLLVRALVQAWKLQSRIQVAGLAPRGLAVELGLIPTITIAFA